jgi:hypothetical protein
VAGREDAPLLFRLRADSASVVVGLCAFSPNASGAAITNATQLLRLGLYSRASLRELRAEHRASNNDHPRARHPAFLTPARRNSSQRARRRNHAPLGFGPVCIKTPDQ